jgi:hypothetical protein
MLRTQQQESVMTPTYPLRLRRTPWTTVLRNAWLTFLSLAIVLAVLPAWLGHALKPLLFALPLALCVAKDLVHVPDALARTRALRAAGRWRGLPAAWLPPELVGLFRTDRALRRGFLHWLLRKPQPAAPAGVAFGYLEQGAYRTGVAIALFCIFVEIPLDAAVVPLLVKDPGAARMLHVLMFVSCLSGLVWVLGDRWCVGAGQHVLDAAGLHLRIGARTGGTIPRAAIAACERVNEPVPAWCRRHGIAPIDTLAASPLDKPNTVLILQDDCPVRLTHWGVPREGLACVFLYVDRPDALAAALRRSENCNY